MGNPVRRESSRGSKRDVSSNAAEIGKQALAARLAVTNPSLLASSDELEEVPPSSGPISLSDFVKVRPSRRNSRGGNRSPRASQQNPESRSEVSSSPREVSSDMIDPESTTRLQEVGGFDPFPERVKLAADAPHPPGPHPFGYPSAASTTYTNFVHMGAGEAQDIRGCHGMLRYLTHETGQVSVYKWVFDSETWELVGAVSPPYAAGIVDQIDKLSESPFAFSGPDRTAQRDSIVAKVKALKDPDTATHSKADYTSEPGDYESLGPNPTQMSRYQRSEETQTVDPPLFSSVTPRMVYVQKDERKATEQEKLQKQAKDAIKGSLGQYEPFAPAGSQFRAPALMSGSSFPFGDAYGLNIDRPIATETQPKQELLGSNNFPGSMPRQGKLHHEDMFPVKPPPSAGQSKFGYLHTGKQLAQAEGRYDGPPATQRGQLQQSEETPFASTPYQSGRQIYLSSNVQAPTKPSEHPSATKGSKQSPDKALSTTTKNMGYLTTNDSEDKIVSEQMPKRSFTAIDIVQPEQSPNIETGSWWIEHIAKKNADRKAAADKAKADKYKEELNTWWYSGVPKRRDEPDEDLDWMKSNPVGDPSATTIGPELLIPALESLRQYEHRRVDGKTVSGEKPEGVDDSYMRYKSVPEWCIDHAMTGPGSVAGNKNISMFGEQEWTQTPERVGRDPRYRPFLETRGAGTIGRPSTRNPPSSTPNPGSAFSGHGTSRKQG